MLRLTELKLPLDHPETALRAAIVQRLGVVDDDIVGFTVHKRSYDARKRRAVSLIYTVDVELRDTLETQHDGGCDDAVEAHGLPRLVLKAAFPAL